MLIKGDEVISTSGLKGKVLQPAATADGKVLLWQVQWEDGKITAARTVDLTKVQKTYNLKKAKK